MTLRLRLGMVIGLALATCAVAGSATASPAQPVTITADTTFSDDPAHTDPFVATGGVVCSSGSVGNVFSSFVGFQSNSHAQILVLKHFVCANGTFDILVRVSLDFSDFSTHGTWSVHHGTGAYAKLHGTGIVTGVNDGDSVLDSYSGRMHID